MTSRRGLWWVVAFALVAAQTLGLMHRAFHPGGALPAAAHAAEIPGGTTHAPAANAIAHLFAHDDAGCRLFDSSCHGAPAPVFSLPLPFALPPAVLRVVQGEVQARFAALFDARGPPSVR
jgi:hypothetical protein